MMRNEKTHTISIFSIFLVLFLALTSAFAIQPTQQFNKLYLTPYYVSSLQQNVNQTFYVNVDPPDGYSSTYSAVFNFQVYAAPSVTFTLYVNNKTCNPASFAISTTYASSSLLPFSFDCSNVITQAGNYTVKLSPSKNTGAATGSLDLTYSNNPQGGSMSVHGTEYSPGDMSTVFLQLTDDDGNPIDDANCKVDIYAPVSSNVTHPEIVNDQNMLLKEEGVYYYDWLVPNDTGVYMVIAKCSHANIEQYYDFEQTLKYPVFSAITGVLKYGTNESLNSYSDTAYIKFEDVGGKTAANVTFSNLSISNASEISINMFFQSEDPGTFTVQVLNWTSGLFVPIQTKATNGVAGGDPKLGYDEYKSASISNSSGQLKDYLVNNTMKFRLNTTTTKNMYYNAIWLYATTFDYTYPPVLRGSGEIHVSLPNVTYLTANLTDALTSVNSSLHSSLANNFTLVLDNQALILSNISLVSASLSGNFSSLQSAIISVNNSLHSSLALNYTSLQSSISDLQTQIQNTNQTLNSALSANFTLLNSNLAANFSQIQSNLDALSAQLTLTNQTLHSSLYNNFTYTNSLISDTNSSLHSKLDALSLALSGNFSSLHSVIYSNFSLLNTNILSNFTALTLQVGSLSNQLDYTNQTLHSALAQNATNILASLSSLSSQVNDTNTTLYNAIKAINITLPDDSAVHAAILGNLTNMQVSLVGISDSIAYENATLHSALSSNFTQLEASLSSLSSQLSYTNSTLHSTLFAFESNITTSFYDLNSTVTQTGTSIVNFMGSNFTYTNSLISDLSTKIDQVLGNMSAYYSSIYSSILSTNSTLHSAISGLSLDIFDLQQDVLSTNTTLHTAGTQNTAQILSAFNTTDYSIWYANETLHSSINGTNILISDVNSSLYNNMISVSINGTNLTEAINATMPTGYFTKMNNLAGGFWILVVILLVWLLYKVFK